jgi:hypothetical protein
MLDGNTLGLSDGFREGAFDAVTVGASEGAEDGILDGCLLTDGLALGESKQLPQVRGHLVGTGVKEHRYVVFNFATHEHGL